MMIRIGLMMVLAVVTMMVVMTRIAIRAINSCVAQMLDGTPAQEPRRADEGPFTPATLADALEWLEDMMQSFERLDFEGELFDMWILE
ncbi:unnamed protein product, partial [Symbiodinium necroappetens]